MFPEPFGGSIPRFRVVTTIVRFPSRVDTLLMSLQSLFACRSGTKTRYWNKFFHVESFCSGLIDILTRLFLFGKEKGRTHNPGYVRRCFQQSGQQSSCQRVEEPALLLVHGEEACRGMQPLRRYNSIHFYLVNFL